MTTEKEMEMTDHIRPDVEEDGLYYKYRVFKEPEEVETHPIIMTAYYRRDVPVEYQEDSIGYAEEVRGFAFVLKPDTDHHARVALASYAASVINDKPRLAQDLFRVLRDMAGELENGEDIV